MPLTKADIDRVCRIVRKELKGSGYHGEGMHGEGMHGEGMHGKGHCPCPDKKSKGSGNWFKEQKRKADKKVKQAKSTVDKGAKQVSRKTKAAETAKEASRYAKDKDKTRNLAANVATTAAEGAVGLAAGTAATAAGGNPVTGALVGAAATEGFKQAGGSEAIGDAIRGQGKSIATKGKKKDMNKKCSEWQKELAKYRKANPGCSLKDAMKACKKKKQ